MSDEQELLTLTHRSAHITHGTHELSHLRTSMRQQRRNLSGEARRKAARALANRLIRSQLLRKGSRVAVYSAIDGEIDLTPAIRHAQRVGCAVYVPRIVNMRTRKMEFEAQARSVELLSAVRRRINPRDLDVVLVPLVAFDAWGWRLGFGAGFYDRKFQFMRRNFRRRPLLVGVGYDFQRVTRQMPQPWDVSLHRVVTERHTYRC